MSTGKDGALVDHYKAEQIFEMEPRLRNVAEIDVKMVINIDSTNADHVVWEKLVAIIGKNYSRYNGFLITYGTNTMAYAASALSFALPNIGKPVVFTGAQIPAENINSDAHNNFVNALTVATMDLAGVLVVFGSKIILGCRSKKVNESELEAFKTFNGSDVGEIRIGIKINRVDCRRNDNRKLLVKNGFNDNIVSVTLIPGLKGDYLVDLIEYGVKGIILRAFGSGDVPHNLLPALEYARKKKVPVVVTTQCPSGATLMGINEPGLRAVKAGVIQAFDMSMEAMSTKLMWLLHQGVAYPKIKAMMQKDLVGEVKEDQGILKTKIV